MKKFLILLACLTALNSCRDDEECPIDPCENATQFKPKFEMGTGVPAQLGRDFLPTPIWSGNESHIRIVSDTILGGAVFFSANAVYDSVHWRIGQEASYRKGSSISVSFSEVKGILSAQMIGFRKADTLCFPNDRSPDTLSRDFTLLPLDSSRAIGKWEGQYIEENSDFFEINIFSDRGGPFQIDNIPWRQTVSYNGYRYIPTYYGGFSRADTNSSTHTDYLERKFRVADTRIKVHGPQNDSITINMRYRYDNIPFSEQTFQPLTFKGKRIL
jgi:hypothetical protein